jgi:hypothetical protein
MASTPSLSTTTPGVLNSVRGVSFSVPILNDGSVAAASVVVTTLSLGTAARLSPLGLPLFVGNIGPGNAVPVSALFDASALTVGRSYLATIGGTFTVGTATFGFRLNRPITVPASVAPPMAMLAAHIAVDAEPPLWGYTVCNDEPSGSPNSINTFALDVAVPFTVTGAPMGWSVITDNQTYVLWYAGDPSVRVAPGLCLSNFQIQGASQTSESTGFALTSWNTNTDQAGTVDVDAVFTPSRLG